MTDIDWQNPFKPEDFKWQSNIQWYRENLAAIANTRFRELDIVKKLADAVETLEELSYEDFGDAATRNLAIACLKRLEGE